ncbi:hypothetical protein MNEG_2020 [Monoraphidium neglectum]|uniref:Uncharacterized protein n=1 Tax=Monoraphidium neglectum TaxID=145388 RepID=A0A0D2K6F6_9CHLO|nr:hypothetical protein MNEG_2020 [Monoraphidium neglectum]KIZ05928.1 hypothetical protein MNEG_2020 [Monoraphidium neglectum]|eukprot:XP_013904947.1 hypothetical protein MNEG_2020 [Monoraphidium neglectum]
MPAACCKGPGYATPLEAKENGPREVVARLPTAVGDELHHTGWNACSSCHGDPSKERRFLIVPAFGSGRIYVIDVKDPTQPRWTAQQQGAGEGRGRG